MKRNITLIALLLILMSGVCFADGYVLIVNKANPDTSISIQEARNIFLGKKGTWSNGLKAVVYTQSGSPVHTDFTRSVVGKTPQQFSTFWRKALFTGTGIPPADLQGDAQAIKSVAAQPGAIGYISGSSLNDSVKQLEIR
ncbi:substrate-binding domain-containing protein [bacterium]|nr:substrate-binding domain-containing protein [bacterium]